MDDGSMMHGVGLRPYYGVCETEKKCRRKLEVPIFNGKDAFGWTNRVKCYFELKEMNDAEKLQAIMVAMKGKALTWYQWWEFCSQNLT